MHIDPVSYSQAKGQVKEVYEEITAALAMTYLPLFFQYIGPFPQYLIYISGQLVPILKNDNFLGLVDESAKTIANLIKEHIAKPEEIFTWKGKYRYSPAYYYFNEDIEKIFKTNIKLAYIFIGLREAVKGWAIAAKKLEERSYSGTEPKKSVPPQTEKDIIFEDITIYSGPLDKRQTIVSKEPSVAIDRIGQKGLEKNLLTEYLNLCRIEFLGVVKTETYLLTRVEMEKIIVNSLPLLPELISSPINVVLPLITKYDNYTELLYLLSENFPTLAAQKVMFSGFLL